MIKQAGQSSGDRALLVGVLSRKSEIEKEQQSLTLVMLSVISAVSSRVQLHHGRYLYCSELVGTLLRPLRYQHSQSVALDFRQLTE